LAYSGKRFNVTPHPTLTSLLFSPAFIAATGILVLVKLDIYIQISYNHRMFSQTAEYALRAIVTLAQSDTPGKTAQDIARESQVPLDYLSKVLNSLARAGILTAQRGRRGGFTLALPAARMTVLDVVNAVDPIRRIRSCPLHLAAHATRMCPLHRKLDHALGLVEDAFATTTIASLCEENAVSNEDRYVAIT
jgi:Rrf2 family transcriptional regulator, nitric oxide-sensitive transcriptional repressor